MNSLMSLSVMLVALAMLTVPASGICGSKMEGTYVNATGLASLDVKPKGKATFTMMTERYACTYKADEDKIVVDCTPNGEKADFMINSDGSLTGPGFIGVMKKSK